MTENLSHNSEATVHRPAVFVLLSLLALAPWSVAKAQAIRNLTTNRKPQQVSTHSDEYPVGSLKRPNSGINDLQLDAAWQAYAAAVKAEINRMHVAINEREKAGREIGDLDTVEKWKDVRATLKSNGILLELPCSAADLESAVAAVERAEVSLLDTYESVIREKTKDGADQFARSANNEKQSLFESGAVTFLPVCENLLIGCVPERDAATGKWLRVANGIRSDKSGPATLKVLFRGTLPTQFDYVTVFTPESGELSCAQLVAANGVGFGCDFGGWGNTVVALHKVDGREGLSNATTKRREGWLRKGEVNVAVLQVRKDSVSAVLNGEKVFVFSTDYSDLAHRRDWATGMSDFGIGSWHTPTVFHRVTLIPQ